MFAKTDNCPAEDWLKQLTSRDRDWYAQQVLKKAWSEPFTTKCDFARTQATIVGMLAEQNYITLKDLHGNYGSKWHITADGMAFLNELLIEDSKDEEE